MASISLVYVIVISILVFLIWYIYKLKVSSEPNFGDGGEAQRYLENIRNSYGRLDKDLSPKRLALVEEGCSNYKHTTQSSSKNQAQPSSSKSSNCGPGVKDSDSKHLSSNNGYKFKIENLAHLSSVPAVKKSVPPPENPKPPELFRSLLPEWTNNIPKNSGDLLNLPHKSVSPHPQKQTLQTVKSEDLGRHLKSTPTAPNPNNYSKDLYNSGITSKHFTTIPAPPRKLQPATSSSSNKLTPEEIRQLNLCSLQDTRRHEIPHQNSNTVQAVPRKLPSAKRTPSDKIALKEHNQLKIGSIQETKETTRITKFRNIDEYLSRFKYLLELEHEEEKYTQNNQVIDGLELRWEVSRNKTMAFFKLPDCKKEVISFFLNKELLLSYKGTGSDCWQQNVRISSLSKSNAKNVEIGVAVKSTSNPPTKLSKGFSINDVWNDLKAKRTLNALDQFGKLDCLNFNIQQSILGRKPTSFNVAETLDFLEVPNLPKLNPSQMQAARNSLVNSLSLIQGPPGTGKTVILATIAYALSTLFKEKILVCASSNVTVDNLAAKINLTGLKVVRICCLSLEEQYTTGDFPLLHRMVEEIIQLRTSKNRLSSKKTWAWDYVQDILFDNPHKIEQRILEKADAILCTCMVAGDIRLSKLYFHTVLIDEATQATEPECLIPIIKAGCRAILVGDQKQLGPVVLNEQAANIGLKYSLFERLIGINHPFNVLQIQFRMHPRISQFPIKQFYKCKLKDGVTIHERTDIKSRSLWRNPLFPIMFYDSTAYETKQDPGFSLFNSSEALKCEEILTALMQASIAACDIGIITPYDAQRSCIRERLELKPNPDFFKAIEVDSIDAYQGREKDYIILSCVRSNSRGNLGFLINTRRLNVALTRARYGLFIIGNQNTLSHGRIWRDLLTYFKENNAIVEKFPSP